MVHSSEPDLRITSLTWRFGSEGLPGEAPGGVFGGRGLIHAQAADGEPAEPDQGVVRAARQDRGKVPRVVSRG